MFNKETKKIQVSNVNTIVGLTGDLLKGPKLLMSNDYWEGENGLKDVEDPCNADFKKCKLDGYSENDSSDIKNCENNVCPDDYRISDDNDKLCVKPTNYFIDPKKPTEITVKNGCRGLFKLGPLQGFCQNWCINNGEICEDKKCKIGFVDDQKIGDCNMETGDVMQMPCSQMECELGNVGCKNDDECENDLKCFMYDPNIDFKNNNLPKGVSKTDICPTCQLWNSWTKNSNGKYGICHDPTFKKCPISTKLNNLLKKNNKSFSYINRAQGLISSDLDSYPPINKILKNNIVNKDFECEYGLENEDTMYIKGKCPSKFSYGTWYDGYCYSDNNNEKTLCPIQFNENKPLKPLVKDGKEVILGLKKINILEDPNIGKVI